MPSDTIGSFYNYDDTSLLVMLTGCVSVSKPCTGMMLKSSGAPAQMREAKVIRMYSYVIMTSDTYNFACWPVVR